jgi:hypothetical protein
VGRSGDDARARQQLAECGHEDERVDERVHPVERPAGPGRPESSELVGGQRCS